MPPRTSRAAARRAWGTRFDSLPASASVVSEDATGIENIENDARDTSVAFSEAEGTRSDVATSVSDSSVASHHEDTLARQDVSWEGHSTDHKISWGDPDQYPTIAPPADVGYSRMPRPRPLQRWDHNASVFVASLPPMPNAELDSLLRGSLGNHGTIINIKFIHDVKSGNAANCAFVQFETPEQARAAIQACHMSFIQGRCIRCEPAKAHRTLLVSFRPHFSPVIPHSVSDSTDSRPQLHATNHDTIIEWVRLRRPEIQSRYVQVTFNDEARNYTEEEPPHWHYAEDRLRGAGALVSLNSDVSRAETMRTLVELFGPLEYFRSFRVPPPEEANGFPYAPHPSLKVESNKAEDALTWEIKWAQRNDAVSAVHTLAQFPNLVVTWAHEHPHPSHYQQRQFAQPFAQPPRHASHSSTSITGTHSFATRSHSAPTSTDHRSFPSKFIVSLPIRSRAPIPEDFPPLPGAISVDDSISDKDKDTWNGRRNDKNIITPQEDRSTGVKVTNDTGLINSPGPSLTPGELDSTGASTSSPAGSVEHKPQSPKVRTRTMSPELPLSPETPASLRHSPYQLDTPSTVAPLTPSPLTHTRTIHPSAPNTHNHPYSTKHAYVPGDSLFVGCLDRGYGWTEAKLSAIFEPYGEIAHVKVVFNMSYDNKPGHAFVKFVDASVMPAAIAGEDDRIFGNRAIRVKYSTTDYKNRIPHWRRHRTVEGLGLDGMEFKSSNDMDSSQPVIASTDDSPPLPIDDPNDGPSYDSSVAESPLTSLSASSDVEQNPSPGATTELSSRQKKISVEPTSPSTPSSHERSKPNPHFSFPRPHRFRAKSDPSTPSVIRPSPTTYSAPPQTPYPYQDIYVPYAPTTMMYVPHMAAQYMTPEGMHNGSHPYASWGPSVPQFPRVIYPQQSYVPFAHVNNTSPAPMSSSSASTTPSPIPQPPVQASGFVHNEQGILIPFYKNDALDQYMATANMNTNSDSIQPTWSEHSNYAAPPWLPQQVMMSQHPHILPAQAVPIEWDASRTHAFSQNPHGLQQPPVPHMSVPVSYVPPAYEHHISPVSLPSTVPASAHPRARSSNPRHSRPHLPRQHSSHSNDQHAAGAAHGPTLQQLVDNNRKNEHRQSHQGHLSQHGRHRHGTSSGHQNSRVGGTTAHYQSYPPPFEGISAASAPMVHHPFHAGKMMSTTHMAGPAQWNALPPAYENA